MKRGEGEGKPLYARWVGTMNGRFAGRLSRASGDRPWLGLFFFNSLYPRSLSFSNFYLHSTSPPPPPHPPLSLPLYPSLSIPPPLSLSRMRRRSISGLLQFPFGAIYRDCFVIWYFSAFPFSLIFFFFWPYCDWIFLRRFFLFFTFSFTLSHFPILLFSVFLFLFLCFYFTFFSFLCFYLLVLYWFASSEWIKGKGKETTIVFRD